jgi:hypothetical protein
MPSQQEEAERGLKARLHQIPHPTDRAMLRRAIKKVVTSLTQAHKVEMEKMVAEIQHKIPHQYGCIWYKTNAVLGNGTCTCIKKDIKETAKKFNIEVK